MNSISIISNSTILQAWCITNNSPGFIFNFKSCKDFIYKFCFLVLLTPLLYTIFSLIVIADCHKTKFLKYVFFPIHKIYEPDKKYICELRNLKKENEIIFLGDSSNLARENPREKGISDLISEKLNQKFLTLSYGAANSSLFEAIIDDLYFLCRRRFSDLQDSMFASFQ